MPGLKRLLRFAPPVLLALAFSSCDQAVRRTLPGYIRAIVVDEFTNLTDQQSLPPFLLEELRREFRLDGRLTVVDSASGADCELGGTVMEYNRQPARFDANNVVQEYRLRVVVDISLKDPVNGTTIMEEKGPESTASRGGALRKLERYTNYIVVPASGVAVETEQDAQRRMVRELAHDIAIKVIEGW